MSAVYFGATPRLESLGRCVDSRNSRRRMQQQNDLKTRSCTSMNARDYQICSNCIMDTTDSGITFDARGWCDYCNNYYQNIFRTGIPMNSGAASLISKRER